MGYEQKNKEQTTKLGKFNVKVSIHYLDGFRETIAAKSWLASGNAIALELYDGSLTILNARSTKTITVSHLQDNQEEIKFDA